MVATCPCCGSLLPDEDIFHGSPTYRRIYEYIRTHPQCTGRDIINRLWPSTAAQTNLSTNIHRMRPILAANGIRLIIKPSKGPNATYRLVKDPQNGPSL